MIVCIASGVRIPLPPSFSRFLAFELLNPPFLTPCDVQKTLIYHPAKIPGAICNVCCVGRKKRVKSVVFREQKANQLCTLSTFMSQYIRRTAGIPLSLHSVTLLPSLLLLYQEDVVAAVTALRQQTSMKVLTQDHMESYGPFRNHSRDSTLHSGPSVDAFPSSKRQAVVALLQATNMCGCTIMRRHCYLR